MIAKMLHGGPFASTVVSYVTFMVEYVHDLISGGTMRRIVDPSTISALNVRCTQNTVTFLVELRVANSRLPF